MKGTQLLTLLAMFATIAPTPEPSATCPPPAPGPRPFLALSYPMPKATAVPTDIGRLILVGSYRGVTGDATVSVKTASNVPVAVGAFSAAPVPVPTPNFIPIGLRNYNNFLAVPIPRLAPSTTYEITYTYTDDGGSPPSCTFAFADTAGSFTTRN